MFSGPWVWKDLNKEKQMSKNLKMFGVHPGLMGGNTGGGGGNRGVNSGGVFKL